MGINFININSINTSSAPMSGVSNTNREKDSTPAYISSSTAKIKYKKIHESDKKMAFGDLPEEYIYCQKTQINHPAYNKIPLLRITRGYGELPQATSSIERKYYKDCYELEDILSPERYHGYGTAAIQSLVERSLSDNKTQGRIILNAKVTDGETSPAGFFYKLGFRFTDKVLNHKMKEWLTNNPDSPISPMITGVMYLPKENINKVLMYKQLI